MRSEIVPLLACEKRKMQPSPGEDVMVGALRVSRAEFTNKGRYARRHFHRAKNLFNWARAKGLCHLSRQCLAIENRLVTSNTDTSTDNKT